MGQGKIENRDVKIMQLIIPMSGIGQRFMEKGYKVPKPLIPISGKPMVQHVIEMFPDVEEESMSGKMLLLVA